MLHPPGFYYVKKPKRFVILSSDKSSERNLSCFFDIIEPRRMEHLQSEEPFSSDPYFSTNSTSTNFSVIGIKFVPVEFVISKFVLLEFSLCNTQLVQILHSTTPCIRKIVHFVTFI